MNEAKILGFILSSDLRWTKHVATITRKASQSLHLLVLCKRAGLPVKEIKLMYISKIRPVLEYACPVWHPGLCGFLTGDIEHVQMRALKIMYPNLSYIEALAVAGLEKLSQRRDTICLQFFKSMENPNHKLNHLIPKTRHCAYNLRRTRKYESIKTKTKRSDGALVNWCLNKHMCN